MKKFVLAIMIALIVLLAAACVPEDPKEIPQYCKELYEANPDYPHQFVGACISVLESGKYNGMASLCGWDELLDDMGFSTRKECIQYFHDYGD